MLMKVLVADDDPQSRELLIDILVKCGCETASAQDGREAVEKITEFKPDLVLMDIKMPVMDGFEALKRIRHMDGAGNIKVIAITSLASKTDANEIEKAGFDGYLPKPVDTRKFRDYIANLRQKKKSYGIKPKILCVDDEPMNLELLEAILAPAGYETLSVNDGHEALAVLKKTEVDLVLLDVMMPGMNGYDICRLIKASAETARVPVIMITALSSKEDRIKSIEAGAEDFITKPFETTEVLTRIRKLLEIKEQNGKIVSLFGMLAALTERGNRSAESLSNSRFNFFSEVDTLIRGTTAGQGRTPRGILLGTEETGWINYEMADIGTVTAGKNIPAGNLTFLLEGPARVLYVNEGESSSREADMATRAFALEGIKAGNFICRAGGGLCVASYDFLQEVNDQDVVVLKAMSMQIMFLRSFASEIKETEKAFDYLVFTLARAAEANDEDTGMHILRIGTYAALVAEKMGLGMEFIEKIKLHAQLHDVGKIHIPSEILRKPGALTPEEWEIMKLHTVYGAKIIGRHERLSMGNVIANYHHERWDGSGYPEGLKGNKIPLEARITSIADQYDALRNARVYKPAFSHEKAYEIIVKGDGRTMPGHFDPDVLSVFIANAQVFEEIYNKLNG
jgi:response regulator RpfG family c-di-GMP phosphodiesterase